MPTSRQKLILQFPGINYHQSLLFRILLLLLGAEVILCGNISCERTNFLFSSCLNNPDNELTVCGVKESENYNSENQLRLTFPTICLACQHQQISFYAKGTCSLFPSEAIFCNPNQYGKSEMCSLEYEPVCSFHGTGNYCIGKECGVDIINGCQACSYEGYAYYIPGRCSDQ